MSRTVLITGASAGIGQATARLFAADKNFITYVTGRNPESLKPLVELGCRPFSLDVTNEASMAAIIQAIAKESGPVDILVNNAGYGQNGVIEELSLDLLRRQFETNVFGLIRMCQLVLPGMRHQGKGRIINIGSAGGDFTPPGAGAYHASKYALEAFSDALRAEVKPFGIEVCLIKPGGVQTNFISAATASYPPPISGNPYGTFRERFLSVSQKMFEPGSQFGILTPDRVATIIYQAATARRPKTRYRVGVLAKVMPHVRRVLSDRQWDRMVMAQFAPK